MKKFIFLYKGFQNAYTGDRAILDGLVQPRRGQHGRQRKPDDRRSRVTPNGVHQLELGPESFTGYSIINADGIDAAIEAREDESDDHKRGRPRARPHVAPPSAPRASGRASEKHARRQTIKRLSMSDEHPDVVALDIHANTSGC